jgi:hypothetical protein
MSRGTAILEALPHVISFFLEFLVLTMVSTKMAVFQVVVPCDPVKVYRRFIALMMETPSISESSVNFYRTTRRYNNPEGSHLPSLWCSLH